MLFLGDIAAPGPGYSKQLDQIFKQNSSVFGAKTIICNFEGLASDALAEAVNRPILFNHPSVVDVLADNRQTVACLANNHILDLPACFTSTLELLKANNILYAGAGNNPEEADNSVTFTDGSNEVILFNSCWDFLLYHQVNPSEGVYISEINEKKLLHKVAEFRKIKPDAEIVLYFHWSFDLETLPFPMYRQFSKALIDAGADLVIGGHSHCVQGGEKYKKGYIVYGLGNFFMPHGVFAGGKIAYPTLSDMELVFEWDKRSGIATCHWFEYQHSDDNHILKHVGSDNFSESQRLQKYSPFQGLTDKEYLDYFKKHRRKKKLIPIYTNYENTLTNWFFTVFLKNRARIARFLAMHNFIKWQN